MSERERVDLNQKWYEHLQIRLFIISFLYLQCSTNVFSPWHHILFYFETLLTYTALIWHFRIENAIMLRERIFSSNEHIIFSYNMMLVWYILKTSILRQTHNVSYYMLIIDIQRIIKLIDLEYHSYKI